MNSTKSNHRFGLALSTLSLALLTACGGGGEGPAAVATAPLQTASAAATTICDVQPTATSGPSAYNISANQEIVINGYETVMSLLTSPTGYPFDGAPVTVTVPLEDLREAPYQGYTPQATLNRMGVEVGSRFKAGAVGCVSSVSRANNVGTALNPRYLLSWASATLPSLPLTALPSKAINGFEFLNNFDTSQATAVFRMAKSGLADPASVHICHISSAGSTHCSAPSVTQDDQQWTFKLAISDPGVYVITAPRELVPAD